MPRYSSARESSLYAGAGLPATHRARRDIGDVPGTRCAVGSLVIFARKLQIERPLLRRILPVKNTQCAGKILCKSLDKSNANDW